MSFTGFPTAALDFYDDLEMDNTKSFWEANKHVYNEAVRAPMLALIADLADEFSSPGSKTSVFRPYRDIRFAKDKTPYKTCRPPTWLAGSPLRPTIRANCPPRLRQCSRPRWVVRDGDRHGQGQGPEPPGRVV